MSFDCEFDPNAVELEQARQYILNHVQAPHAGKPCLLHAALNKILAETVYSPCDVPPAANSAMDGYAFACPHNSSVSEWRLECVGSAWAGTPFLGEVLPNQCIRIMTGAWMPAGTDTVVMQEHVTVNDTRVGFPAAAATRGANVRYAGDDIKKGSVLLEAGKALRPADVGLLASVGLSQVKVFPPVRVGIFTTGDELRLPGEELLPGQIYNSNRYTLLGMLQRLGAEVQDLGNIADNPAALKAALQGAASSNDMVITTGGVSVGDADYIKPLLQENGDMLFWKIAMKPGRPFTFGRIASAWFFGLPGNPVSVMATFYYLVQPAIVQCQGMPWQEPLSLLARCTVDLKKKAGRLDLQRGVARLGVDGTLEVGPTGDQGSHVLSSMSQANCFIVLPREQGPVAAGSTVRIHLFCGMV